MNVTKSTVFVTVSSALACSYASADTVNRPLLQKPNFLIVVCEDISPYLGCYGDDVAITPNLDAFSDESILHTNMYTCVGVSSPSRYALITGRYASTDGANYMRANYFNKSFEVIPPDGVRCYTELLRREGYYCTNNAKTDYQFNHPQSAWDEQGNAAHWKHTPADRPFLATFNLNVTHESFIWKNTDKPLVVHPDSVLLPPYYPDNQVVRHDMAVLYSNIAKMDQQFAQLIQELEASDRAKNTIVIFYSDNGGPLPRAKRELMDSGTRVPFMIRFPDGWNAGMKNEAMNMFVDIPATILSLAHIKRPSYMHGQAMYGEYAAEHERRYVFGATDRFDEQVEKRASIRSDHYLYLYNYMPESSIYKPNAFRLQMPMMRNMVELYEAGKLNAVQSRWFEAPADREELYDCRKDPHQIHNLANDPNYKKVLEEMRLAFKKEWIEAYNADWVLFTEDDFIHRMWPEKKKPQASSPRLKEIDGKIMIVNAYDRLSMSYQINGKGLNGNPAHWRLYTAPIELLPGDELTVKAERIGYAPSSVVRFMKR